MSKLSARIIEDKNSIEFQQNIHSNENVISKKKNVIMEKAEKICWIQ